MHQTCFEYFLNSAIYLCMYIFAYVCISTFTYIYSNIYIYILMLSMYFHILHLLTRKSWIDPHIIHATRLTSRPFHPPFESDRPGLNGAVPGVGRRSGPASIASSLPERQGDDMMGVRWRFGWSTGDMDVSLHGGTSKSSILIGFSLVNHPYWGTTILGNPHIPKKTNMTMEKQPWTKMHLNGCKWCFFQCHVSFQGGVKKRLEHGGKMYWNKKLDHDVLVSKTFSVFARLVEISEPPFENGFKCYFSSNYGETRLNSSQAFSQRGFKLVWMQPVMLLVTCMLMESLWMDNPPMFSKTERSTCTFCVHPLQFGDKHDYRCKHATPCTDLIFG